MKTSEMSDEKPTKPRVSVAAAREAKRLERQNKIKVGRTSITVPLNKLEDVDLRGKTVVYTDKGSIQQLSPGQVSQMRGRIARMLNDKLHLVEEVIDGTTTWNAQQVRLFTAMLNKVVPDLSASYHQHEHRNADLKSMSKAELERIAAGLDDSATIEAEHKLLRDITPAGDTDAD